MSVYECAGSRQLNLVGGNAVARTTIVSARVVTRFRATRVWTFAYARHVRSRNGFANNEHAVRTSDSLKHAAVLGSDFYCRSSDRVPGGIVHEPSPQRVVMTITARLAFISRTKMVRRSVLACRNT